MLSIRFKIFCILILFVFTNSSCSNVKKAFDPERKDTSEEFLVEKKTPLSIPPDFEKLPVPQSEKNMNKKDGEELQILLEKNEDSFDKSNEIKDTKIEKLILDKIQEN